MPIIPSPAPVTVNMEDNDKATAVPFDVTLAVDNVSETLFTIPAGRKLRGFSIVNKGPGIAHVSMVANAAATTADTELTKDDDAWSEDHLDLPEGDYEFINGGATNNPRLVGVAWHGPA